MEFGISNLWDYDSPGDDKISQMHVFITETMQNLAFPALLIVILIPLLLGTLTGYNLGAVALSYPLVESFFVFTGIQSHWSDKPYLHELSDRLSHLTDTSLQCLK